MRLMVKWFVLVVLVLMVVSVSASFAGEKPLVETSDGWEFIVNNAVRTADEYAMNRNPASTFACGGKDVSFVKQVAGRYKGKYILYLTCRHANNVSFAGLLPRFDVNQPASKLNDENPRLWRVIVAKLNGRPY